MNSAEARTHAQEAVGIHFKTRVLLAELAAGTLYRAFWQAGEGVVMSETYHAPAGRGKWQMQTALYIFQ